MTIERRTPIGVILDQIVVYIFTSMLAVLISLIGWLCIQTIALKQDTAKILEHGTTTDRVLEKHEQLLQSLAIADKLQVEQIEDMRVTMARHNIKEEKNGHPH